MAIKSKTDIAREALEVAMQELERLDAAHEASKEAAQRSLDAAETEAARIVAEAKEKAEAIAVQTKKLQDMFSSFAGTL